MSDSVQQIQIGPNRITRVLPEHIANWQLPPDWQWGAEGLWGDFRHYQEVIDALGRSLSLVTVADPAHYPWLFSEAKNLAHRSHPFIPTTYHYWTTANKQVRRGPGYLRRWITGETVRARLERSGPADIPYVLQVLRSACSALAYLHDAGTPHGSLTADSIWVLPTERLWLLEWQWAIPNVDIPPGLSPTLWAPPGQLPCIPPEWREHGWNATRKSDQWQVAAMIFFALTGEVPPTDEIPPVKLVRPECPTNLATAIDYALNEDPEKRFDSVGHFLRAADKGIASRSVFVAPDLKTNTGQVDSEEDRLRMAVGDDYEIISMLGSGNFGTVWRARDLSLEREVALKVLHPAIAKDGDAVAAFWREARLAAQLAHPAIVPIFDWDSRGGLSWYTMELEEGGSVANLVTRRGARTLAEIAPQVELVLDGLSAAHAVGIIHRDLKPENILIDRYRRWRLTDFGIANVTGVDKAGTTGTPAFASPEQLLGETQGAQTDLFSLAAIVAYTLSGNPPFGAADPKVILAHQLGGRIDLTPYPMFISDWLSRALAAEPDARFQDAAAMKSEWRKAVKNAQRLRKTTRFWRKFWR